MNYSDDLDKSINKALDELIKLYENKAIYFNDQKNKEYYYIYKEIKERENSSNFSQKTTYIIQEVIR